MWREKLGSGCLDVWMSGCLSLSAHLGLSGSRFSGSGFWVLSSEFWVLGSVCLVLGSECWALGFWGLDVWVSEPLGASRALGSRF
jgi:hypothetical protein